MDENDPRNKLILIVVQAIKDLSPDYILIENVPQMLSSYLIINNNKILIKDYIEQEVCNYKIKSLVLDAADYGVAQHRKRAFILISKIKEWQIPKKQKRISVKECIGHLPSLKPGEDSTIPWHKAKKQNDKHILWMKHTPSGETAFNNAQYYPEKDGRKIKGFATTYKRMDWEKPAPTITMGNGAISSQNNVHPGYLLPDGTYSDPRVLTIKELMLLSGIDGKWKIPSWAKDNLIRHVIGEQLSPIIVKYLVKELNLI
jgi:DNA (cytosine-5)-methyltransferase 1